MILKEEGFESKFGLRAYSISWKNVTLCSPTRVSRSYVIRIEKLVFIKKKNSFSGRLYSLPITDFKSLKAEIEPKFL